MVLLRLKFERKAKGHCGVRLYVVTPIRRPAAATMAHATAPIFRCRLARARRRDARRGALEFMDLLARTRGAARPRAAIFPFRPGAIGVPELRLDRGQARDRAGDDGCVRRSEEHTSEL